MKVPVIVGVNSQRETMDHCTGKVDAHVEPNKVMHSTHFTPL